MDSKNPSKREKKRQRAEAARLQAAEQLLPSQQPSRSSTFLTTPSPQPPSPPAILPAGPAPTWYCVNVEKYCGGIVRWQITHAAYLCFRLLDRCISIKFRSGSHTTNLSSSDEKDQRNKNTQNSKYTPDPYGRHFTVEAKNGKTGHWHNVHFYHDRHNERPTGRSGCPDGINRRPLYQIWTNPPGISFVELKKQDMVGPKEKVKVYW